MRIEKSRTTALGIVCILLAASLVGVIANYTSTVNAKDSRISSLYSQMQTLTSQRNQLQTWLSDNVTSLNSQITDLQSQVASANSQISSLNSTVATLQSQVSDLTAIVNMIRSKLETLVFHVQETGEDWCRAPDINHIYQQISALNNNTYDILLLPQRNYENWTAQRVWLEENFNDIPIMLDVFGSGPHEFPVPKLSTSEILATMAVCNVKWLRISEVVSWHIDHNVTFPIAHVKTILDFCRANNLKLFWTEYKVGGNVFQTIQTCIAGYEDFVTVSFSTNSGELKPADGFIMMSKMFQHWGGSVQSWYWETWHRPNDDPHALTYQMPASLLTEHALLAKYVGAEVIQFEPYWYFFDNGEAKENLNLLMTMLT